MHRINAIDLIKSFDQQRLGSIADEHLFLSGFSLTGDNQWLSGTIRNVFIRPDFILNITELQVKDDISLESAFPTELVGFTFCLQGKATFEIPIDNSELSFSDGISTIYKTPAHTGLIHLEKGQRYVSLSINLELSRFIALMGDMVNQLENHFLAATQSYGAHILRTFPFSAKLRLLLEGLISDDYKGLSQQFFIESKVLEIMGLQLERLSRNKSSININADDLTKIQKCEALLRMKFNQPHSLIELARQVGLNDFKLKQGFKQVYGKPVFKYLQEYRLQKAMESLRGGNKLVTEVAEEIGYSSVGSFSNAFYEQFGIRPGEIKSV